MSDRTPIQIAAKRLYDALDKAQSLAGELIEVSGHKRELYAVEHDIERAFDNFVCLLHEDDCK